ncbi:MAG: ribonuclease [Clostridia bacterium]|nr:ribonuclease [Clostridia bacterium]
MEKLFKNKSIIAVIAAVLLVGAAFLVPKLTGKPLSALFGGDAGEASQAAESRRPAEASGGESSYAAADESAQSGTGETTRTEESGGQQNESAQSAPDAAIAEDGSYTSKEDVALYLRTYGRLPQNFIAKSEANKLGWEGGDLWRYAPGKSIGGDVFGNREGLLPKKSGRTWYECDIDYAGGSRGAKRICYSSDGLIYYTDDHYETFTELKQG